MTSLLLALDFGGTKHSAAILARGEREWRDLRRASAPLPSSAEGDLTTMRALVHALLNGERPPAIGVSFGGPVDAAAGVVQLSHHVPGWERIPLRDMLQSEFGAKVSIDNDANVAALGEHRFGAGVGCDSLMYITVSTGVGGGLILDGRIWRGADGMAGEIGHTVVDPAGPLCLCGKRGCVERLASGPYIAQDIREQVRAQPERGQVVRAMAHDDLDAITAQMVAEAAARGDALALEALERAGRALGMGIGNAANLLNPQRFILGGGVTKSGPHFWETLRRTARATALPQVQCDIVPALLGDDAPLWGAVALAEDLLH
jgi:glucokinase